MTETQTRRRNRSSCPTHAKYSRECCCVGMLRVVLDQIHSHRSCDLRWLAGNPLLASLFARQLIALLEYCLQDSRVLQLQSLSNIMYLFTHID